MIISERSSTDNIDSYFCIFGSNSINRNSKDKNKCFSIIVIRINARVKLRHRNPFEIVKFFVLQNNLSALKTTAVQVHSIHITSWKTRADKWDHLFSYISALLIVNIAHDIIGCKNDLLQNVRVRSNIRSLSWVFWPRGVLAVAALCHHLSVFFCYVDTLLLLNKIIIYFFALNKQIKFFYIFFINVLWKLLNKIF